MASLWDTYVAGGGFVPPSKPRPSSAAIVAGLEADSYQPGLSVPGAYVGLTEGVGGISGGYLPSSGTSSGDDSSNVLPFPTGGAGGSTAGSGSFSGKGGAGGAGAATKETPGSTDTITTVVLIGVAVITVAVVGRIVMSAFGGR